MTGYSLGLIGGVRSWVCLFHFLIFRILKPPFCKVVANILQMMGRRKSLRDSHDSQPPSPDGSDEDPSKSPESDEKTPVRGRQGKSAVSADAMED